MKILKFNENNSISNDEERFNRKDIVYHIYIKNYLYDVNEKEFYEHIISTNSIKEIVDFCKNPFQNKRLDKFVLVAETSSTKVLDLNLILDEQKYNL